jgi:hypothetical protein
MADYNFTLNAGFSPYILRHIKDVVGEGNSYLKLDNLGFLNLLNSQKKTLQVNRPSSTGQIDFVKVKYLQRAVDGQTQTSDSCSVANTSSWLEADVPLTGFRQYPLFVNQVLMQEYQDDAARTQTIGTPPTPIMGELLDEIYGAANALLVGVDKDLQSMLVTGVNPSTGNSNSTTINITQNTVNLPLNDGVTRIVTEAQKAEFADGKPQIYGSGLFYNYMQQQRAKGIAISGLNTVIEAGEVDFFYDQYAATILGQDEIRVISPDSTQLVEFQRFTGGFGGMHGATMFGTLMLPMKTVNNGIITLKPIAFDYILRYLDCPETVAQVNDYYGSSITAQRGYQLILQKAFGLFQPPAQMFKANDFLANSNGCLAYNVTNV